VELEEADLQELNKTIKSEGFKILILLLEEQYSSLLADQENSSTGEEALARVKIGVGFRQALDVIYQISSREEVSHEESEDLSTDNLAGSEGRSRHVRRRRDAHRRSSAGPIESGTDGPGPFAYGY